MTAAARENYVEAFEKRVRASFARQAFMKTLGAEIISVGRGTAEIRIPFSAKLTQQDDYLHAAAITAILDSACGYAAYSVAPGGSRVLSVEFKVNLLAPAVGEHFIARAAIKRAGKNLTACTADAFAIEGKNEKLVATMLATIVQIHKK